MTSGVARLGSPVAAPTVSGHIASQEKAARPIAVTGSALRPEGRWGPVFLGDC